jgi:hypothetical protein
MTEQDKQNLMRAIDVVEEKYPNYDSYMIVMVLAEFAAEQTVKDVIKLIDEQKQVNDDKMMPMGPPVSI